MADQNPLNQSLPAHPGPVVKLGGQEFVMPPMSMRTRKEDANARAAIASGATELDDEAVTTRVVLATLQRNYPSLTLEQLDELASYPELVEAYLVIKEQEAKLMFELGKRVAAGPMVNPVAADR